MGSSRLRLRSPKDAGNHLQDDPCESAVNASQNSGREASQTSGREPKRILVVDDTPEICSLMQQFLEMEGYEVFCCADVVSAVEVFAEGRDINLLITDIHMPGISGIRLAYEVARSHPEIPIVIASSSFLTAELWNSIQGRGWHFLSKPFYVPELLHLVRTLLAEATASAATL